jgi:dolichyl-phosphate beta-glucosyltransferase
MDISIIIPAYNEQNKISADIIAADKFISDNNYVGEIIIVDDGSSDKTYQTAVSLKEKISANLNVIKLSKNLGKGGAVREGIINSNGEIVIYADAGLTVPFENALIGIKLIKEGKCDIANGSRKLDNSTIIKQQDFDRKIISKIFLFFIKLLLKVPQIMTDTQCGFKIYKGEIARKLFNNLTINGFLFEIEIIQLANVTNYKILEFPVTWKCDRDSRLSISRSSKKIIIDFISLIKLKK